MIKNDQLPTGTSTQKVVQTLERIGGRVSAIQVMIREEKDSALILEETASIAQAMTQVHAQLVRVYLEQALLRRGTPLAGDPELERLFTEIARALR